MKIKSWETLTKSHPGTAKQVGSLVEINSCTWTSNRKEIDDKKISLNDKCLNAKDVYRNFMSEINGLVDSEGESIIKAKTNNEDILTFTYKRNASFTFSYHLTRILGIREQTYKISKIINEPSEDVNDSNESIENAEDTKKPKLHKDFNLGYAVHTKDPVITAKHPGIRYSYINKIRNVDNVNDLVDQFIGVLQEKTNIDMHLEERRLRLVFPYDLTLEIQPHLANILGFTDVSRQFTYMQKKDLNILHHMTFFKYHY